MDAVAVVETLIDNWNMIVGTILVTIAVAWGWRHRFYRTVVATVSAIAFFVM